MCDGIGTRGPAPGAKSEVGQRTTTHVGLPGFNGMNVIVTYDTGTLPYCTSQRTTLLSELTARAFWHRRRVIAIDRSP